MRIAALETFPIALPFRERYMTASGSLQRREMVIVRISAAEGAVGHGDAVPLSLRGGPTLAAIDAELRELCRPVLEVAELDTGRPAVEAGQEIRPVLDACAAAGAGPGAIAAVDAALLDLFGHVYDLPAWAMLGASEPAAIACNGTLGAGAPAAVAGTAAKLVEAGFRTLKIKVGTGEDAARVEAVREACGEDVALRVDANGAWGVAEAARKLRTLAEVGLELAEQPCATLGELAELRAGAEVAIVADESVATAADAAQAQELEACDAITLKLAKVGGPHASLAIAADAPAYLSSALDSALGIAAAVHTAQALPARGFAAGLAHGLATSGLFADNVADLDGLGGPDIDPPVGPGLGVVVDEGALARLAIRI